MKVIRVAVDLTPMLAGGANGGVKPAIMAFLRALQTLETPLFSFCFITSASVHNEILSITTDRDELICIDALPAGFFLSRRFSRKKRLHLMYAPFGMVRFIGAGLPVISMVVDLLHRDYPYSLSPDELQWREKYFAGMVDRADRFQVISDYTGERLLFHYEIAPAKIFRTYLPIQDRFASPQKMSQTGRPFFIYPANFWPHKNHEVLLIAYQIYHHWAGAEAWDLILIGSDNPNRVRLEQLCKTLGIQGNVIFKSHLPEEELASIFSAASALVFPSLHEGFGIPTLEAMKLGVPILASHAGSLKEVVGEAGLLADPKRPIELAKAMLKLAGSKELQAKLKQRGYDRANDFSFSEEALKLGKVFLEEAFLAANRSFYQRLQREVSFWRDNFVFGLRRTLGKLRTLLQR